MTKCPRCSECPSHIYLHSIKVKDDIDSHIFVCVPNESQMHGVQSTNLWPCNESSHTSLICVSVCVCWCEGTLLPLVAEVAPVSFMKPHHSPDVEHELSRCLTKARVSVPPLPSSPPPPPLQLLPVRLLSLSRQDPWSGGHLLHIHTLTTRTPYPETRLPAVRWSSSPGARRRVPGDAAARLQSVMVSRTADSDPLMRRGARRRWSRPRTAALHRTRESNPQSGTL